MYIHYVYFVQQEKTGPIKIGVTRDVAKRMESLKTGSPYELNLIASIKCEGKRLALVLEKRMHKKFSVFRFNGEWFSTRILQKMIDMPEITFIDGHWVEKARTNNLDQKLAALDKDFKKRKSTKTRMLRKQLDSLAKAKPSSIKKRTHSKNWNVYE